MGRPSSPPRVVFLESLHGIESLFTAGLRAGAAANGVPYEVRFLRGPDLRRKDEAALRRELEAIRPDLVCFLYDAPLGWENLWSGGGPLREIPKASFWFDDFVRSPLTMERPDLWRRWQEEERVSVFMHDGFWRGKWALHTGAAARPVDLAADARLFPDLRDAGAPLYPELDGHAVMLGTIPSAASFQDELAAFPPVVRKWFGVVERALEVAPWPFRPYEIAEEIIPHFTEKERLVLEKWRTEPGKRSLAAHQLWRRGKRAARLRGLRALAQRVPVAVLSGHGREPFARGDELREAIAPAHGFEFRDTTKVPDAQWGALFRSGAFQVQWVDPQSIESGAPFRMFEAAAGGVPLLADARPGFPALFAPDTEMLYASDEAALAERAAALLAGPREDLRRIGENARAAFLARHTWAERWRQVERALGLRDL